MSLFQSGHANGEVSLEALFNRETQTAAGIHPGFDDLLERIVIGGWPGLVTATVDDAREWLSDYITQIAEVDVQALGSRRNPRNIRRLMAALARSVGRPRKEPNSPGTSAATMDLSLPTPSRPTLTPSNAST